MPGLSWKASARFEQVTAGPWAMPARLCCIAGGCHREGERAFEGPADEMPETCLSAPSADGCTQAAMMDRILAT
jgi:hypothetical protein